MDKIKGIEQLVIAEQKIDSEQAFSRVLEKLKSVGLDCDQEFIDSLNDLSLEKVNPIITYYPLYQIKADVKYIYLKDNQPVEKEVSHQIMTSFDEQKKSEYSEIISTNLSKKTPLISEDFSSIEEKNLLFQLSQEELRLVLDDEIMNSNHYRHILRFQDKRTEVTNYQVTMILIPILNLKIEGFDQRVNLVNEEMSLSYRPSKIVSDIVNKINKKRFFPMVINLVAIALLFILDIISGSKRFVLHSNVYFTNIFEILVVVYLLIGAIFVIITGFVGVKRAMILDLLKKKKDPIEINNRLHIGLYLLFSSIVTAIVILIFSFFI